MHVEGLLRYFKSKTDGILAPIARVPSVFVFLFMQFFLSGRGATGNRVDAIPIQSVG